MDLKMYTLFAFNILAFFVLDYKYDERDEFSVR